MFSRTLRRWLPALLMPSAAMSLVPAGAQSAYERDCARLAASSQPASARLASLFKLDWEHTMREHPEYATEVGYPGFNDRWTDKSIEAVERRKLELLAPLKVIRSINRARLNSSEQLSYDLFRRNLENAVEGAHFKSEDLAMSQLGGVQQGPAETLENSPHANVRDYENVIARLKALPRLIDQNQALLEKGLKDGVTQPRVTLWDVPRQVEDQMVSDPARNPLLKVFGEFPMEVAETHRARLRAEAAAVLKSDVIPAYARFLNFLTNRYIPGARETIAMSDLPDGKAWYAFSVRDQTTTSMTPEQIHAIGLAEVKRIRAEMDGGIAQTGFKGDFGAFCDFLRTDPRFFCTNKVALLAGYRDIAKRLDPELVRFFGKLPRLTYGVKAIPDYAQRSAPTAYYQPGSLRAGRAGYFCANTYELNTRPKWEMEALTAHEAVPGHHLQISLAQEMEQLPEFRRHGGYTAFVEGWGLYAESLGAEMGLYKDHYSKFGELTYDMWRAIRLVVDTGIHSMGWSRRRAIDYFLANSSKSEHDVTVEVDRYIAWPGQALAYKIGEMKFKELRAYAIKELGDQFDIRAFHDQLLTAGALPLDVLDRRIRNWVDARKRTQQGP